VTFQRICSLLPSTTEIVCALGLADNLVAITHECDYPAGIESKPRVTRSAVDHEHLSPGQIDSAVRSQLSEDDTLYHLNSELLRSLRPDLILTQELCDVCAVSFERVRRFAGELDGARVVSLDPHHFWEVLECLRTVGDLTGTRGRAETLIAAYNHRIGLVASRTVAVANRPRVALLEWLDPYFRAGHWTPEIIELAGGIPVTGAKGEDATVMPVTELAAAAPDAIVVAQCGFDLERSVAEAKKLTWPAEWRDVPAFRNGEVYVVDGNAYFSRPGPRIVESLEIMAEILMPSVFSGLAPSGSYTRLELGVSHA
jgi:iron complex transport system substrate-binding protein